jgi:type II secretory pathway component PulL
MTPYSTPSLSSAPLLAPARRQLALIGTVQFWLQRHTQLALIGTVQFWLQRQRQPILIGTVQFWLQRQRQPVLIGTVQFWLQRQHSAAPCTENPTHLSPQPLCHADQLSEA